MVASTDTVLNIIDVVKRHVDDATFLKIIVDLQKVSGNKSFRETISRLKEQLSD